MSPNKEEIKIMEKLKNSSLLRMMCYLLIPVLVLILIVSIAHVSLVSEFGEVNERKDYLQTENFAHLYFNTIVSNVLNVNSYRNNVNRRYSPYMEIENNEKHQVIYYEDSSRYNSVTSKCMDYIILDKKNGAIYTNIKSGDYQKEMESMKDKKTYWNYTQGQIQTNMESINQDNIKFLYSSSSSLEELEDIEVYSSFNSKLMATSASFSMQQKIYDIFKDARNAPAYLIPITVIALVLIFLYLCFSIGHQKGKEGIELTSIDRFPYEILVTISFTIIGILCSLMIASFDSSSMGNLIYSIWLLCYLGSYVSIAVLGITTIKRIKAKEFWHSFLIYRIFRWVKRQIAKVVTKAIDGSHMSKRITFFYIGFVLLSIFLGLMVRSGIAFIILIAFWIWVYYQLLQYGKKMETIQNALKDIYEGKKEVYLKEEELSGLLKRMAKYINDIAGGFSNAIEESLKSERLKTELITNVSHDIKTPLTSIINYVDLLKEEEIENPKTKEYLVVLDKKSQQLKKLIEDLVEASKVSSGNVQLNMETINLKELLNQTRGEFEDRFEQRHLQLDMNLPKEDVKIQADDRYFYRIIENLFSNVTKYAMENTRVYLELINTGYEIHLIMKNISKEKLNISADELMQRFVRGDRSRYTEGSGLGLSIAQSLTELQGGKFQISIDGDLFKAEVIWKK